MWVVPPSGGPTLDKLTIITKGRKMGVSLGQTIESKVGGEKRVGLSAEARGMLMQDVSTLILMKDLEHGLAEQMRGMEQMMACSSTPEEVSAPTTEKVDGSSETAPAEKEFDSQNYMNALISAMSAMSRNLSESIEASSQRTETAVDMGRAMKILTDLQIDKSVTELGVYMVEVAKALVAAARSSMFGYLTGVCSIALGACLMTAFPTMGAAMIVSGMATIVIQALVESGIITADQAKWANYAVAAFTAVATMGSTGLLTGAMTAAFAGGTIALDATGQMEVIARGMVPAVVGFCGAFGIDISEEAAMIVGQIVFMVGMVVAEALIVKSVKPKDLIGGAAEAATNGAKAAGKASADVASDVASGSANVSKTLNSATKVAENVESTAEALDKGVKAARKTMAETQEAYNKAMSIANDTTATATKIDKAAKQAEKLKETLDKAEKAVKTAEEGAQRARRASETLRNAMQGHGGQYTLQDVQRAASNASKMADKAADAAQGLRGVGVVASVPRELGPVLDKLTTILRVLEGAAQGTQGAFQILEGYYMLRAADSKERQGPIEQLRMIYDSMADMAQAQAEKESEFIRQQQADMTRVINDTANTVVAPQRALVHAMLAG